MGSETDWSGQISGKVDWNTIHQRLKELEKYITAGASPSGTAKERILRERANILAKAETHETTSTHLLELLFFQLSGEDYAIESKYVQEVHPLDELTELPGLPSFVLGISYLRGRVVSVVDLGRLFDLPREGLTDQDRVIVVSDGVTELGLLANVIVGISMVSEGAIQEPLATLSGLRREILFGVTRERAVVLDMARLLSHERLQVGKHRE